MVPLRLYLASASPRRRDLLRGAGFTPQTIAQDFAERPAIGEAPRRTVLRLAEGKARRALELLAPAHVRGVILAADTEVVLDGAVLGKPTDAAHAGSMLRRLSGRAHEVITGVFLLRTDDGRWTRGLGATVVEFNALQDEVLDDYVACGEPMGKAGAYAIQGEGRRLVRRIDGSWSNVVGLPLESLEGWLRRIEIDPAGLRENPPGPHDPMLTW